MGKKCWAVLFFLWMAIQVPTQSMAMAIGTTIDFEGLSSAAVIPQGYAGLGWSNYNSMDLPLYTANVTPGGKSYAYINLSVSDGLPPFIGITSAAPGQIFDFFSGWFSSGWTDNLSLNVQGYNNGSLVNGYDSTVVLSLRDPEQYIFDYIGIDELRFSVNPGTYTKYAPGAGGSGKPYYWQQQFNFMFDDLQVSGPNAVPLPGAFWFMFSGLAGCSCLLRKKAA